MVRKDLRKLTQRVDYLDEDKDIAEIRALLVQDQLQEACDEVKFQRQVIEKAFNHTNRKGQLLVRVESMVSFSYLWIDYVYCQLVYLVTLLIMYF